MVKSAFFSNKQPGGIYMFKDESATTGDVFFVDSGSATKADSVGAGQNPDKPFATIDFAVGQCTASNGDRIYVMPGHAEAVIAAQGLDFDVAGIEVIGLGNGTSRPTITLDTATTATVEVGAVDVTLKNLRFVSDINDLAILLDVNFGTCHIENCDFISSSAKECFCFIDIATTKDDFVIKGCKFLQPTDPDTTTNAVNTGCIYIVDSENILIEDCWFGGNFESSIIHNKTTKVQNLWVKNCYGNQSLAGAEVITLVAGATGGMFNCLWTCPTNTVATEASWMILAASTPFGFFNCGFMNDGVGGGNLALDGTAVTA